MSFVYWIRASHHTDMTKEGYVGVASRTVAGRFAQHQSSAARGSKLPVHAAIRKYADTLSVVTLIEASASYCYELENKLRPKPNVGYNVAIGGGGSSTVGTTRSQSAKDAAAAKNRGRAVSSATRQKIANRLKGKPKTPTHVVNMANAKRGSCRTQEAKDRQSKAMMGRTAITEAGRKRLSDSKRNLREWEHSQSNKDVWSRAAEAYAFKLKTLNFSQRRLAKEFGVKDSAVTSLFSKLLSGWNPLADEAWLAFKGIT